MKTGPIAGIILAAGSSSRMGRLKQLLPYRGRPVLEIVVQTALDAGLEPAIVVLGYQAPAIRQTIQFKRAKVIVNPDYKRGQSSSLQAGLSAVPSHCAAVMFLLGDQPLVALPVVTQIVEAYRHQPAPIVIPTYLGKRGNPVIVDRALFGRLNDLTGDTGARALFEAYADQIYEVAVDSPGIHFDLDTSQDYDRLIRSAQKQRGEAGTSWQATSIYGLGTGSRKSKL